MKHLFKHAAGRLNLNCTMSITPLIFLVILMIGLSSLAESCAAIVGVTVACLLFQTALYPSLISKAKLPIAGQGPRLFAIALSMTMLPAVLFLVLPGNVGETQHFVKWISTGCYVLFAICTHYYLGAMPPVKEEAEETVADLEKRLAEVRADLAGMTERPVETTR